MKKILIFAFLGLILAACQSKQPPQEKTKTNQSMTQPTDIHSFANSKDALVKHLHLDLEVDFQTKILKGSATLQIQNLSQTDQLILDTHHLTIQKVLADGKETTFSLGEEKEFLGQALNIKISPTTTQVQVFYQTSPQAEALQWLDAQQTSGKKHPFLFTQSQAILARTWTPCQDSPSVRMTYSAKIKVPKELMALMSASNPTVKSPNGVYNFEMKQPIPSYLLALAVGDVAFKEIGTQTGVYAEAAMLDKAVYEFAETQKMLEAAEKLYGKYAWERYDLLVLPPSFPFGGMENPRLTFATPTVIAGDRSLTSLIAHELAHSWSGNLVTNATWNDFWLNEGFTVYFERRIMEKIYGKDFAEMETLIGWQGLQETVSEFENGEDTKLKLNLKDRNPDDGVSEIAYEKGFFFLKTIESAVGREKFDVFLNKYFSELAFQSNDTERFLEYLNKNLLDQNPEAKAKIEIQKWVYQTGIPESVVKVSSVKFQKVDEQLEKWKKGTPAKDLATKNWTSQEWLRFIKNLPEKLDKNQMTALDAAFKLSNSGNAEILGAWFVLVGKNNFEPAYPQTEKFLASVGRRKFILPIYKAFWANSDQKTKDFAKNTYQKYRANYHFVAVSSLDVLFKS